MDVMVLIFLPKTLKIKYLSLEITVSDNLEQKTLVFFFLNFNNLLMIKIKIGRKRNSSISKRLPPLRGGLFVNNFCIFEADGVYRITFVWLPKLKTLQETNKLQKNLRLLMFPKNYNFL